MFSAPTHLFHHFFSRHAHDPTTKYNAHRTPRTSHHFSVVTTKRGAFFREYYIVEKPRTTAAAHAAAVCSTWCVSHRPSTPTINLTPNRIKSKPESTKTNAAQGLLLNSNQGAGELLTTKPPQYSTYEIVISKEQGNLCRQQIFPIQSYSSKCIDSIQR